MIEIASADPTQNKDALMAAYGYLATYFTQKEQLEVAKTYWQKIENLDPGNAKAKQFFEYYQQVREYKAAQQSAPQN